MTLSYIDQDGAIIYKVTASTPEAVVAARSVLLSTIHNAVGVKIDAAIRDLTKTTVTVKISAA